MDDDTHGRISVQPDSANFLTPKDLQRELRIGERLAYRLLREGVIPSIRIGNLYRIPRAWLDDALSAHPGLGGGA